jgi:hypothetical protein
MLTTPRLRTCEIRVENLLQFTQRKIKDQNDEDAAEAAAEEEDEDLDM